jgi:hypothetical protein
MEHQIRCKVTPGQFSIEYAVSGAQANGKRFSLFAPVETVESEGQPTRERAVQGWLKVELWEQKGNLALVKLPGESFESGRFVTVDVAQLRMRPESVGA